MALKKEIVWLLEQKPYLVDALAEAIDQSDLESCTDEEQRLLLGGLLAFAECAREAEPGRKKYGPTGDECFTIGCFLESSRGELLDEMRIRIIPNEPQWGGTYVASTVTAQMAQYMASFSQGLGVVRGLTRCAPYFVRTGLVEALQETP